MTAVRTAAALVLLAASGCQTGSPLVGAGTDPRVFSRLDDPQGSAAYETAMAALARGDRAAALVGLRKTVELCPEHVRAHRLHQDVARQVGGEAETTMRTFYRQLPERQLGTGPSPVPAYLRARLADTSYAQGNALQDLLKRHPDFAWGHLSLGRVSRQQGRLLAALDSFGRASSIDAQFPEPLHERAQVLAELGRFEEAARDYEAYLRMSPDDGSAIRAFLDVLIYRLWRIDRALELLAPMMAAAPDDVELRMQHAAAMWQAGRPRQALDGYLAVLEREPVQARALFNVGLLYYEGLAKDEATRRRLWPQARLAFRGFLACEEPQDGHEQFERSVGVPFRLARIEELLGPAPAVQVTVDALRWRDG